MVWLSVCCCPMSALGNPLPTYLFTSPPSTLSVSIFYLFSFLLISCIFLHFHPFPFYHSATPLPAGCRRKRLYLALVICIGFVIYITACTVVQAVVKATSQSNGKGQISTPWASETLERISMKLGIYNRVAGMPAHANPCGAATTWVVWANT